MNDEDENDDKVGYKKPPKRHQWKKGRSGNIHGRPKRKDDQPINIAELLEEPIIATIDGKRMRMDPYRASLHQLVRKAIKEKNIRAILEFLDRCEAANLFAEAPQQCGVVFAPPGVDFQTWLRENFDLSGTPYADMSGVVDEEDSDEIKEK